MKYLVLGSEGQIGKPLVKYLKDEGHEVIGVDIEHGKSEDLRGWSKEQDELFGWADFVFFLAFDVGGSRYLKEYEKTIPFMSNNCDLMSNTFKLLKWFETPFIFASSQMSTMSWSTYGNLKMIGEKYTEALDGMVVHFWNVYGPETDRKKFHVISDFIESAKDGKDIQMLTDGRESRQMLYVEDACQALYYMSNNYTPEWKITPVPITSFEWVTIKEIADIIANHFDVKVIPGEACDDVQKDTKNRPAEKIKSIWKPTTRLEDGIMKIIKEMS